jgi:hypothetical protein
MKEIEQKTTETRTNTKKKQKHEKHNNKWKT